MKEKLQTKFATRQYMISDTFELYYYSTDDVPGVKEHTHTHYEFYLFLEGAISLEIDGVLYTPTCLDFLISKALPWEMQMISFRRFVSITQQITITMALQSCWNRFFPNNDH